MITSKLTSKAQTTIPQPVRARSVSRQAMNSPTRSTAARVILTKASDRGAEDPFGAFTEWDSEADRKAYAGL